MTFQFRPALQTFEERLAPAAISITAATVGGMYITNSVGVPLPGTGEVPPPPPPSPPPPPPQTGGM